MKKVLGIIISGLILFSSTTIVANAETSYVYYWGQGCSYCAKVDAYFKGVEDISKINIDKREVYFDRENAKSMSEDATKLGLKPEQIGVPFLIINNNGEESYLSGDAPIIEYFKPVLGESIKKDSKTNKTMIIVILGILAILIPVFIIKGGSKN